MPVNSLFSALYGSQDTGRCRTADCRFAIPSKSLSDGYRKRSLKIYFAIIVACGIFVELNIGSIVWALIKIQ
jgi:hypothetical protein